MKNRSVFGGDPTGFYFIFLLGNLSAFRTPLHQAAPSPPKPQEPLRQRPDHTGPFRAPGQPRGRSKEASLQSPPKLWKSAHCTAGRKELIFKMTLAKTKHHQTRSCCATGSRSSSVPEATRETSGCPLVKRARGSHNTRQIQDGKG